jgi:hypothetical protein
VTKNRIRLSVLADELGIAFPALFGIVCRLLPQAIDNDIRVSTAFADVLREQVAVAA